MKEFDDMLDLLQELQENENDSDLLNTQTFNTVKFMVSEKNTKKLEELISKLSNAKKKTLIKKTEQFKDLWQNFHKGSL